MLAGARAIFLGASDVPPLDFMLCLAAGRVKEDLFKKVDLDKMRAFLTSAFGLSQDDLAIADGQCFRLRMISCGPSRIPIGNSWSSWRAALP